MPKAAATKTGKPPLIERAALFHFHPIAPDDFTVRLERWKAMVVESYPDVETVPEWTVNVPTTNGIPDFTAVQPQLSLRHRLWKKTDGNQKTWAIQCFPERVTFNVVRKNNELHSYAGLRSEIEAWLPAFSEAFQVRHFTSVNLEYLNRLDAAHTPQFMEDSPTGKIIRLAQALKIFSNIRLNKAPGLIVPPYDCKVTEQYTGPVPGQMALAIKGAQSGPAITVSLRFSTPKPPHAKELDCATALERLDSCHALLLEAFSNVFTETALKSFGLLQS